MKQVLYIFVFILVVSSLGFSEEITPIGNLEKGTFATIEGEVVKILDEDKFRLQDETGKILVYTGWQNRVILPVGERIVVSGRVDDGFAAIFRLEIYAVEIVREDGSLIKLHTGDELHYENGP
jgi:hypothetical protein